MTSTFLQPVADQQVLVGLPAVLDGVLTDGLGEPVEAGGTVTVRVVDATGTELLPAGTATTAGGDGALGHHQVTLPANANTALAWLTAVWTDSAGGSVTTLVEVVGRFWFSIADAIGIASAISEYKPTDQIRARRETEDEAEGILNWACVPRYARLALDGSGDAKLNIPHRFVRAVRSVRVYTDATHFTSFDAGELAELVLADNRIERPGTRSFDEGRANIVIEYEHGWDRPVEDLKRAAIQRFRNRLSASVIAVSDRSTSYTDANGTTFRIAQPDAQSTGLPAVDAVYQRIAAQFGGKEGPAYGSFDYDPSRTSVYHGEQR